MDLIKEDLSKERKKLEGLGFISSEDAVKAVEENPSSAVDQSSIKTDEVKYVLEKEERDAALDAQAKADILNMRKTWSFWLLISIIGIVVFDMVVVVLVGAKILEFAGDYFLPVFIGESLLQMFALAIIIVKALFDGKFFSSI